MGWDRQDRKLQRTSSWSMARALTGLRVKLLGFQPPVCDLGKSPILLMQVGIIILFSKLTIFIHLTNIHLALALGQASF